MLLALVTSAAAFYFLADIPLNPLIVWTALPLYVSYYLINRAIDSDLPGSLLSAYGFMLFSIVFSLFYHLTWYLDWQGTRTGSSTSGLIFLFLPVYAIVIGFVGYLVGKLIARFMVSH